MDITRLTGSRIRMFRRLRQLSQQELANRIHKSKSVVSKYEAGQTNIDVSTLYEIAAALGIRAELLLPSETVSSSKAERHDIFENDEVYLALWVGELWKGILSLRDDADGVKADLYIQTKDYSDKLSCRALYSGRLDCSATGAVFCLNNVVDSSDIITISLKIPKGSPGICVGILTQFGYLDNLPCASPVILSSVPFTDLDKTTELLRAKKTDIYRLKKLNLLASTGDYIRHSDITAT